jgi:hypothetical protein
MRAFIFLLIVAAAVGGYFYFVHDRDTAADGTPGPGDIADAPEGQAAPQLPDTGEPARPIDPLPPATPTDGFVPPDFQPIETVVGNWRAIPPRAFPRDVTLAQPVSFQMTVGSSSLPAGAKVVALGMQGDDLIVAPSATAPARGRMNIDDTNYKDILSGEYDAWKDRMTERARQQWEYTRTASQHELRGPEAVAKAEAAGVSGPPAAGTSESRNLVMQSLTSNPLRELQPGSISKVGEPALIDVEGQTYWAIAVDFIANTRFGPYPTQAQALIRNNRVERWIYTGSGEPVP